MSLQQNRRVSFSDMNKSLTITNGNIGVGTTAPSYTLDINGSIECSGTNNTAWTPNCVFSNNSASGSTGIASFLAPNVPANDSAVTYFGKSLSLGNSGSLIYKYVGSNNASNYIGMTHYGLGGGVFLLNNGNVGINTDTPAYKLDVTETNSNDSMRIKNTNAGGYAATVYETTTRSWYMGAGGTSVGTFADKFYLTGPGSGSQLVITTAGNVGLSTASPASKLHVFENLGTAAGANTGSIILDHDNSGGASSITFRSKVNRGSDYAYIQYQDASTVGGGGEAAKLIIGTQNDADDHIILDPSGSVGIGTGSPGYKLDVAGSGKIGGTHSEIIQQYSTVSFPSGSCTKITGNSAAGGTTLEIVSGHDSTSDRYLLLAKRNTSNYMSIRMDGNVGIGTASPGYTLDVNGTGRFTGKLTITGTGGATGFDTATNDQYADMRVIRNSTGPDKNMFIQYQAGASSSLYLYSNNTETMVLNGTNVGIGVGSPSSKLHVNGNRINIHNSAGINGGQNLFGGVENANARAQIVLSSQYSDLVIASSTANDMHGSTLTFASYNPSNSSDYRKWVINQGNWGARVHMLEFGYNPNNIPNPHTGIDDTYTTMTLDGSNKRLGIGTRSPGYPLHVNGGANANISFAYYAYNGNAYTGAAGGTNSYSIYASSRIAAVEFNAFSDSRIKKDIVDVNDTSALSIIRQIEPKLYTYKDVIGKGTRQVWGFIAQQVRSVLDYSTELIKDFIPNVYELADVTDGNTLILPTKTTDEFSVNGRVRLVVSEERIIETKITSIINSSTFTVEETLPSNKAFVYGMEIDDFHTLNKDAIFTVATAALQEVDRQLQQEKTVTQQQATTIQNLETRIINLEARLTAAGL